MPPCETRLDDIDIGATGCHGGADFVDFVYFYNPD